LKLRNEYVDREIANDVTFVMPPHKYLVAAPLFHIIPKKPCPIQIQSKQEVNSPDTNIQPVVPRITLNQDGSRTAPNSNINPVVTSPNKTPSKFSQREHISLPIVLSSLTMPDAMSPYHLVKMPLALV
jgi:hypothetical protein